MSFRFAMQGRRAVASLQRPHEICDQSYEYLIAQRQSDRQELMFLAEAGSCTGHAACAPDDLSPRQVMIATLVTRGPDAGSETFLLNRYIPDDARFEGLFLPAEGWLRLSRGTGGFRLSGICRVAWADRPAATIADQTIARALSAGPAPVGCVLHLDAAQLPWNREILPHDFASHPVKGDCT